MAAGYGKNGRTGRVPPHSTKADSIEQPKVNYFSLHIGPNKTPLTTALKHLLHLWQEKAVSAGTVR